MNISTLPSRLAALAVKPNEYQIVGGIAADIALCLEKPDLSELTKLNAELVPFADQLADSEPTQREHRAYIRGMLSGLSIVLGVLERRIERAQNSETVKAIARKPLHQKILASLNKMALTNKEISDRLKVDPAQTVKAIPILLQHDLIRLLPTPTGGDKREKLYRLTMLGIQQISATRSASSSKPERRVPETLANSRDNSPGEPTPIAPPEASIRANRKSKNVLQTASA